MGLLPADRLSLVEMNARLRKLELQILCQLASARALKIAVPAKTRATAATISQAFSPPGPNAPCSIWYDTCILA